MFRQTIQPLELRRSVNLASCEGFIPGLPGQRATCLTPGYKPSNGRTLSGLPRHCICVTYVFARTTYPVRFPHYQAIAMQMPASNKPSWGRSTRRGPNARLQAGCFSMPARNRTRSTGCNWPFPGRSAPVKRGRRPIF